jgi:hypothetical protein
MQRGLYVENAVELFVLKMADENGPDITPLFCHDIANPAFDVNALSARTMCYSCSCAVVIKRRYLPLTEITLFLKLHGGNVLRAF